MEIRVIRSRRRRRTISARMEGECLLVRAPQAMSEADLGPVITRLREQVERRIRRRREAMSEDLRDVFERLNRRYFGGRLAVRSIAWSDVQRKRYGSCNPASGSIRISRHLSAMPLWVRDYVVVHEMCHLLESGHGPAFRDLVDRYRLAERARGYLLAKDFEGDEAPAGLSGVEGSDDV